MAGLLLSLILSLCVWSLCFLKHLRIWCYSLIRSQRKHAATINGNEISRRAFTVNLTVIFLLHNDFLRNERRYDTRLHDDTQRNAGTDTHSYVQSTKYTPIHTQRDKQSLCRERGNPRGQPSWLHSWSDAGVFLYNYSNQLNASKCWLG